MGTGFAVSTMSAFSYGTEQGDVYHEIENGVLFTNEPEAILIYTVDVTDTTKFPASFLPALSYLLASYVVGGIVRGKAGAQLAKSFRDTALMMAGAAATTDANASTENTEFRPLGLQVR